VGALVARIEEALTANAQCFAEPLAPAEDGRLPCALVEARADDACACERSEGRKPLADALASAVKADTTVDAAQSCLCEIIQAGDASVSPPSGPEELYACQNDPSEPPTANGTPVDGWCYVDATRTPPLGAPALAAACPGEAKRRIRFAGAGAPTAGAALLLVCEP